MRSCSRNVGQRSDWRTLCRDRFGCCIRMFKTCYGTCHGLPHSWRPCPPITVCVMCCARRRFTFLEASLATWATKAGHKFRSAPAPSGITSPRSPRSVPGHLPRPHREQFQTSQLVSSVDGCAMHMKWLDGIGRGSWDRGNPKRKRAIHIPALPALTGHAIRSPHAG